MNEIRRIFCSLSRQTMASLRAVSDLWSIFPNTLGDLVGVSELISETLTIGLELLFTCLYFRRLWIIHEIKVENNVLVMFGSSVVLWEVAT